MNDPGGGTPAPDEDEYAKRQREAKQRREEAEAKADKVFGGVLSLVSAGIFTALMGMAKTDCDIKAPPPPPITL